MQKIDLYQNIIQSFSGKTNTFTPQLATKENAGGLPEYKKADLQVVLAAIKPYTAQKNADGSITYVQSNKQLTQERAEYELLRKENNVSLIKNGHDIQDTKYMDFGLNVVYHIIWGDGINSLDDMQKLYDAGFRSIQLVYESDNKIAHCYKSAQWWLTEFWKDIVQRMDNHKMIVDTANMNYQSMMDVYKYNKKPILNSHTNILSMHQDAKNIADDFLDLITQSNGIVGLSLSSAAISGTDEGATIEDYFKQIEYIRARIGDDNIALGSGYHEFDFKQLITGYEAIGSLATIEQKMIERFGYKFTYRFFRENPYRFIMETM